MLTEATLAERLGIDRRTLARLRRRGLAPPHVRIGGSIRYARRDVEDWLTANVQRERGATRDPGRATPA